MRRFAFARAGAALLILAAAAAALGRGWKPGVAVYAGSLTGALPQAWLAIRRADLWHRGRRRRPGSRRPAAPLRSTPLDRVTGGRELLLRLPKATKVACKDLDLGMVDSRDLPEVAELMQDAFERVFVKDRITEGWNPLASIFNAFNENSARKSIAQGLQNRLAVSMQYPSLRRPVRRDESIAIIARERRAALLSGPIVAYFELCTLPPDGRKLEDEDNEPITGGPPPEPYLSNLFVVRDRQRQGLGRTMLRLAEDVVACAWRAQRMYLHIDGYEPSRRLYVSGGYATLQNTTVKGAEHMWRQLRTDDTAVLEEGSGSASGEDSWRLAPE